jgi:hypothetical protein
MQAVKFCPLRVRSLEGSYDIWKENTRKYRETANIGSVIDNSLEASCCLPLRNAKTCVLSVSVKLQREILSYLFQAFKTTNKIYSIAM